MIPDQYIHVQLWLWICTYLNTLYRLNANRVKCLVIQFASVLFVHYP